jgi:hypothetical protein
LEIGGKSAGPVDFGGKTAVGTLKRSALEMRKSSYIWKHDKQKKMRLLGIESLFRDSDVRTGVAVTNLILRN